MSEEREQLGRAIRAPDADMESLADSLDSRKRLLAEGYRQKACENCRGKGCFKMVDGQNWELMDCLMCSGRGWVWEAPIGG